MAIRGKRLIQRFWLPIYHRTKVKDESGSVWGGGGNPTMEIVTEAAEFCTLQQPRKQQLSAELQGLSVDDIFIVRTNIPVYTASEGTDFLGSGFYIPPCYFSRDGATFVPQGKGGYYNVVEVKNWNNGVFPHFEATIVKDQTVEAGEYPTDKVSLTETDMDTIAKLKAGDWVTGWTA